MGTRQACFRKAEIEFSKEVCSVFRDTLRRQYYLGASREFLGRKGVMRSVASGSVGESSETRAVLPSGLCLVLPLQREPSRPAAGGDGHPALRGAVAGVRAPAGEAAHARPGSLSARRRTRRRQFTRDAHGGGKLHVRT